MSIPPRVLALVLLASPALAQDAPGDAGAKAPNVLLILADDLGWGDLGCYGNEFHETPNLDRLAREGALFTDAYANAPNCAPTRACLMSGQYTPRHGVYTVAPSARGKSKYRKLVPIETERTLDDDVVTLPEVLRDAGYATAMAGKWHLGADARTQGFDFNAGGGPEGHPKNYSPPYGVRNLEDGPEGEYLTGRLTDEALAFLAEERDGPFFLYVPYYAVHSPIQARPDLEERYAAKAEGTERSKRSIRYAAMVAAVDENVGRLLAALDESGEAEDTLVIFLSDNGGVGGVGDMGGLRGAKGMLYEGGVRVPFLVRWPGRVEPGRRISDAVIGTDVFPTLLEAAGIAEPEEKVLDGESLVGLLEGGELRPRSIVWHFPAYLQANANKGTWRTTPAGSIRREHWKLLEFFEDGRLELYDLEADAGETRDLAAERPDVADMMHRELVAWRRLAGAPTPTERNPDYDPD